MNPYISIQSPSCLAGWRSLRSSRITLPSVSTTATMRPNSPVELVEQVQFGNTLDPEDTVIRRTSMGVEDFAHLSAEAKDVTE
jgi:hypothetical protein